MGSHSVTCRPTEVKFPPSPQVKLVLGGMQGWVDLVGLLHAEMVYSPEDDHPSKYWPVRTCVNSVHAKDSAYCHAANAACFRAAISRKVKVFPYSLPSVGPGADPCVQAVSPQVTWNESRHRPVSRLPLLSARPAVTSVAFTRWHYL